MKGKKLRSVIAGLFALAVSAVTLGVFGLEKNTASAQSVVTNDTPTVYTISDITADGAPMVEYTNDPLIGKFPAGENVALKFEYKGAYVDGGGNARPYVLANFGFMFDEENLGWDDTAVSATNTQKGVWLRLWDWGYQFGADYRINQVFVAGGSESDRIASNVEYVLEVGMVNQYTDGEKSGYLWYFEVNGARKLEVVRPLEYNAAGGACVVFGEGVESLMHSTNGSYAIVSDVGYVLTEYDEVKTYDYEDLTGEYKGAVTQEALGAFEEKVNVAMTTKVKANGAPVGFILSNKYTFVYENGKYAVKEGDTILAEADGELTDETELEIGFKKCYKDGAYAGVYAYIDADGNEAVGYLDNATDFEALDGSVKIAAAYFDGLKDVAELCSVGPYLPKSYDWENLVVYDLYDLTGMKEIQWTGLPVFAQLPTNNNAAFRFYVDGNGYHTDGHLLFSLVAFSISNDGWRSAGSVPIFLDWSYDLYASNQLAARKTGVHLPNEGNQMVEIGSVKGFREGEWVGNYVYLKINGVEVCSYVDTENYMNAGKNIAWGENTSGCRTKHAEGCDGVTCVAGCQNRTYIRTTYEFYEGTVENCPEQIEMEESFVLLGNKDVASEFPLSVQAGYSLDKVFINGVDKTEEVLYVGKNGGYKLVLENIEEDMTFRFEVSEKAFALNLPSSEDYVISAPASVAYAGSATIAVAPKAGKLLTSVSVNGKDVTAEGVFHKGVYTFVVYGVTEDQTVAVTVEDKTYAVTATTEGAGASVNVTSATVGAYGTATVEVSLQENWYVTEITCNGKAVSMDENGTVTIEYVTEDLEIKVKAVEYVYVPVEETKDNTSSGCAGASFSLAAIVGLLVGAVVLRKKEK